MLMVIEVDMRKTSPGSPWGSIRQSGETVIVTTLPKGQTTGKQLCLPALWEGPDPSMITSSGSLQLAWEKPVTKHIPEESDCRRLLCEVSCPPYWVCK